MSGYILGREEKNIHNLGYNEIQKPRKRYALINYKKLTELLHSKSIENLKDTYKEMD